MRSTPPPVRGHFPCSPHCCARKKVAEELAAHGARVVLACRTAERAHEAASSIATATGCLPELLHPAEVRTSSACAREVLVSPPLWLRSTSATWPACVPSQNAAPPSGAGSTSSSTMQVSCCPRCGPPSRLASGAPSRWRLLLPSVAATRERARNGAHSGHQLLRAFPPHPVPPSAAESHRRGAQRNVVAEAGGLTAPAPCAGGVCAPRGQCGVEAGEARLLGAGAQPGSAPRPIQPGASLRGEQGTTHPTTPYPHPWRRQPSSGARLTRVRRP